MRNNSGMEQGDSSLESEKCLAAGYILKVGVMDFIFKIFYLFTFRERGREEEME